MKDKVDTVALNRKKIGKIIDTTIEAQRTARFKKTKSYVDPIDEKTIRKEATEVTNAIKKEFPKIIVIEKIENEEYRPPFSVSWTFSEK